MYRECSGAPHRGSVSRELSRGQWHRWVLGSRAPAIQARLHAHGSQPLLILDRATARRSTADTWPLPEGHIRGDGRSSTWLAFEHFFEQGREGLSVPRCEVSPRSFSGRVLNASGTPRRDGWATARGRAPSQPGVLAWTHNILRRSSLRVRRAFQLAPQMSRDPRDTPRCRRPLVVLRRSA